MTTTTQKMFKYQAVGALLQEGKLTRTKISKETGVAPESVLLVERLQDRNLKTRAFWNLSLRIGVK